MTIGKKLALVDNLLKFKLSFRRPKNFFAESKFFSLHGSNLKSNFLFCRNFFWVDHATSVATATAMTSATTVATVMNVTFVESDGHKRLSRNLSKP